MDYSAYDPVLSAEIVRLRRRIEQAGVPPKKTDQNLLVATWNLRAFGGIHPAFTENPGSPKRNLRGLAHIAEIVSRFDVIAIQEVKSELTAMRMLLDWLGPAWGLVVTDVTHGGPGNQERLGFLFDRRRVEASGLAGELVLPPLANGDPSTQFARTPYAVSFRTAEEEFVLVTCHVLYGDVPEDRTPELLEIAQWMSEWGEDENRYHRDLIVLGDFNIDRRGDPRFEAFTSTGLNVPTAIRNVQTNVAQDVKHYDQIGWFMGQLRMEFTGHAGAVDFSDAVFQEIPRSSMTWRVSDHLPLWAEFSIDRSVHHLMDTLDLDPQSLNPFDAVPD